MDKIKKKVGVIVLSFFILVILAVAEPERSVLNSSINETPTGDQIIRIPTNLTNETLLEEPLIEQPFNETVIEEPIIETPSNGTGPQPIEEPALITTLLSIVVHKFTAFVGDIINIQAFLTYENQTPLPDKKIDFYADELIGSDVTDNEGKAELQWNTSSWLPKAYTITANYSGDGELTPASREVNIEIRDNNAGLENISTNNTAVLNGTFIYWDTPQFPFQNKSPNEPLNLSNLRPELIKENKEVSEVMSELRSAGYYVRSVRFGVDREGFYVLAALVKTKNSDYDAESKEIFGILNNFGYADYYGVEIINIPKERFVDYKVAKPILTEFISNKMEQEEFNNVAGAGVKILPPPHPTFVNRRITENVQMIKR